MRHSLLSFLLMLLIAGQSVTAMADFHLVEQNPAPISHDLDSDVSQPFDTFKESVVKIPIDQDATSAAECIDCNDCYCCAFIMLSDSALAPPADITDTLLVEYDSSQVEAPGSSLLRPPKI